MSLEQKKMVMQISKHQAVIDELEYKIAERLADIQRMNEHKEKQRKLIEELTTRLQGE